MDAELRKMLDKLINVALPALVSRVQTLEADVADLKQRHEALMKITETPQRGRPGRKRKSTDEPAPVQETTQAPAQDPAPEPAQDPAPEPEQDHVAATAQEAEPAPMQGADAMVSVVAPDSGISVDAAASLVQAVSPDTVRQFILRIENGFDPADIAGIAASMQVDEAVVRYLAERPVEWHKAMIEI